MTSDEIRYGIDKGIDRLKVGMGWNKGKNEAIELEKYLMLGEIAAQLAELNEHFRKADESVFGVKDNNKEIATRYVDLYENEKEKS